MDAYVHWVFWRVAGADFDAREYPRCAEQARRDALRPAHRRALAIEDEATAALDAAGLRFTPPPLPT